MKIALVHELLTQDGGAERMFQAIAELFPEAPLFTTFYYPEAVNSFFQSRDIRTAYVQSFSRLPFLKQRYNHFLALLPHALEKLDFSEFDVVISSSSGLVKSIITRPETFHLCYCHSPARYLWLEPEEYLQRVRANPILKLFAPMILEKIRAWDKQTATRPDQYVAVSEHVRERIRRFYERESEVVHPFADVNRFAPNPKSDFFLTGGRLVAYKKFDIVVRAFNKLGMSLVVFGTGPEESRLRSMVKHSKIRFVGKISEHEKADLFGRALAFINPQEEDFGITPIEALASGTPVIALARGGALEVVDETCGVLLDDQSWEAIAHAVIHFDASRFDPEQLRARAARFSKEVFQKKFMDLFDRKYEEFKRKLDHANSI